MAGLRGRGDPPGFRAKPASAGSAGPGKPFALWLVAFPEAFINGTIVTALVVFYPDWLETFNRSRYLQAPWKENDRSE